MPANLVPPAGLPRSLRAGQLLAVNLGKNKASDADSNDDYIRGVRTLGPYADVVVINVSSPNTPGLRALQGKQQLERLLNDVVDERNKIAHGTGLPKIAVKVASDLSEDELADVASAVRSSGVEGVIVSNTTIRRKELNLISGTCPHLLILFFSQADRIPQATKTRSAVSPANPSSPTPSTLSRLSARFSLRQSPSSAVAVSPPAQTPSPWPTPAPPSSKSTPRSASEV